MVKKQLKILRVKNLVGTRNLDRVAYKFKKIKLRKLFVDLLAFIFISNNNKLTCKNY